MAWLKFSWRAIWTGGSAVGIAITLVGAVHLFYATTGAHPPTWLDWRVPWYVLVIGGLVIVLLSSLRKAYTMYRDETNRLKGEANTNKRESDSKFRALLRQSYSPPPEPLSLDYGVRVDKRSLADIYPDIKFSKNRFPVSAGFLWLKNSSQEPVDIEVECKILQSNAPIMTSNRVDNVPWVVQGSIQRSQTISPHGSWDLLTVMFKRVDKFHMGFMFPSCLFSREKRLGFRVEGRVSTYRIAMGKILEMPYIDIELKIIAVSAINERKSVEYTISCHVEGDVNTTNMLITPRESKGVSE